MHGMSMLTIWNLTQFRFDFIHPWKHIPSLPIKFSWIPCIVAASLLAQCDPCSCVPTQLPCLDLRQPVARGLPAMWNECTVNGKIPLRWGTYPFDETGCSNPTSLTPIPMKKWASSSALKMLFTISMSSFPYFDVWPMMRSTHCQVWRVWSHRLLIFFDLYVMIGF